MGWSDLRSKVYVSRVLQSLSRFLIILKTICSCSKQSLSLRFAFLLLINDLLFYLDLNDYRIFLLDLALFFYVRDVKGFDFELFFYVKNVNGLVFLIYIKQNIL